MKRCNLRERDNHRSSSENRLSTDGHGLESGERIKGDICKLIVRSDDKPKAFN